MKFKDTPLKDLKVIETEPITDERGHFARVFCVKEFETAGIDFQTVQRNQSFNHKKGTLRGMHYQRPPSREGKIVRCIQGGIFDVLVDLRPDSPSFLRHLGFELTPANRFALYIPPGFAHGFQTLADDSEVWYQMTDRYRPEVAGGFRWDDPAVNIEWPMPPTTMSERDATYPDLDIDELECLRGEHLGV